MATAMINGIRVHHEDAGSGMPILFVHGLGSSALDWTAQVSHFSTRYRVVTYDARGHGRSGKPRGTYSMRLFAEDAVGLLDHLGIESAHVVGISMGGMIAFQLAVDHPNVVRSLVVVNSGPELIPRTLGERLQIAQRFLIVRLLGMRRMAAVLAPRLFPRPEQESLRTQFIERWAENDTRAYLASMKAIIGWGVTDRIGGIEVPTLFVAADQDYTPVEAKERFAAQMPNAGLTVIEDSRHATPIERPEELNRAIEEFLKTSD